METENKFIYRIEKEDTLEILCERFNTSKENILRNNNLIDLYVGEIIEITVNDYVSYIVKPMDSLKSICSKFDIDIEVVKLQNKLKTEKLFIGQVLKIHNKKTL